MQENSDFIRNVALNKITGAWDEQMLAELLKDIEASGLDAMVTGFEPPEMEQLFNKVATKAVEEDDFDVEAELKKPTFSRAGDQPVRGKRQARSCGGRRGGRRHGGTG